MSSTSNRISALLRANTVLLNFPLVSTDRFTYDRSVAEPARRNLLPPGGPSLPYLSVRFRWSGSAQFEHYSTPLLHKLWQIHGALEDVHHRQRRKWLTRRDLLTYLQKPGPASSAALRIPEWRVALSVLAPMEHGRPAEPEIAKAFFALSPIRTIESTLKFDTGWNGEQPMPMGRADGEEWSTKATFFPEYTIDLGEIEEAPKEQALLRLVVLIAAVEVRRQLELYYQTGMYHLVRCHRGSCGAWFTPPRMGVRSKFCSGVCRVGALRDSKR